MLKDETFETKDAGCGLRGRPFGRAGVNPCAMRGMLIGDDTMQMIQADKSDKRNVVLLRQG